jgi:hypothetical protein
MDEQSPKYLTMDFLDRLSLAVEGRECDYMKFVDPWESKFSKTMGVLGKMVKDQYHCNDGSGIAAEQEQKNSQNLERLLQESELKRVHEIPHLILEPMHPKI